MSYSKCETVEIVPPGRRFSDTGSNILTAKVLRFVGVQVSEVEFLLAHPIAELLEFHHCSWDLKNGNPNAVPQPARGVRLVETTMNDMGFNEILIRFQDLRSLVYFRPSDEVDTNFNEIGRQLANHGQKLENLELYNEALMPFYTPFGSLQMLINLKTLEMDLELLIGFRENPRDYTEYLDAGFDPEEEELDYEEINYYAGDWSLVKLLPPSLEKLILQIEYPKLEIYFNTYERYGAKFEELMTAQDQFPKLRWVEAPRLNTVAEKLCGRETGWRLMGTSKHVMGRFLPRPDAGTDDAISDSSSVADTETVV